jgi:hypothetical protein
LAKNNKEDDDSRRWFQALTRVAGIVAAESDGSEENMWDLAESAVEMVGKKQNYTLL